MIVEDSATQAEILRRLLMKEGYTVTIAKDGAEGLEYAHKLIPQLILCDINMPVMNGYQLCKAIKTDEAFSGVLVLLLTSLTEPKDIIKGLECEADSFIPKPYDEKYLLACIQHMILNRAQFKKEPVQSATNINYGGQTYAIRAGRMQILNLLLTTYDVATIKNIELTKLQEELKQINMNLEEIVIERTSSLLSEIERRKQIEQVLSDSEETFRTIASSAHDAIIMIDKGGNIFYWNLAAEFIFGWRDEEIHGKNFSILISNESNNEVFDKDHNLIISSDHDHIDGRILELIALKKDGSEFPIEISLSSINLKGQLNAVGIIRDISDRKKAEDKINQLNVELEQRVKDRTEQLEAANKELEAFSYSVSHDLRAPIRHIAGFVELLSNNLKENGQMDDNSQRYLNIITDSAKQMGMLIDDLLSFSRMSRSDMNKTSFDINSLIKEVIHSYEPDVQGRDISWKLNDFPQIYADYSLIRVVLNNLISNAIKFTRTRPQAIIEIGYNEKEDLPDNHILFVKDNGVGFDMNYANKLFLVFQRLHTSSQFEGTGIGLATVARIVQRHGGHVWAEGFPEQGASFYFTLPKQDTKN